MTTELHRAKYFLKHLLLAKRGGHGVHSPFAYRLCEEVLYNKNPFYNFAALNKIRTALLRDDTALVIEDHGAGSKSLKGNIRKVRDIVATATSTKKQSELLYRLANFLNCQNIVELGTSVGINSMYLAMSHKNCKVFTIEGSRALNEFAKELGRKWQLTNITNINGLFDEVLPTLLNTLSSLDLYYIDGNHTFDATLKYFNLGLEKKHDDSVFVLDDIYWSRGMTMAWKEIKSHPSVTFTIDAFYFGMVFFRNDFREPVHLRLLV
jgi:predicted O-methyltransferase YrrM